MTWSASASLSIDSTYAELLRGLGRDADAEPVEQSDGLGVYAHASNLVSQIQAIGDWGRDGLRHGHVHPSGVRHVALHAVEVHAERHLHRRGQHHQVSERRQTLRVAHLEHPD
jgi:hypothetical protein